MLLTPATTDGKAEPKGHEATPAVAVAASVVVAVDDADEGTIEHQNQSEHDRFEPHQPQQQHHQQKQQQLLQHHHYNT